MKTMLNKIYNKKIYMNEYDQSNRKQTQAKVLKMINDPKELKQRAWNKRQQEVH